MCTATTESRRCVLSLHPHFDFSDHWYTNLLPLYICQGSGSNLLLEFNAPSFRSFTYPEPTAKVTQVLFQRFSKIAALIMEMTARKVRIHEKVGKKEPFNASHVLCSTDSMTTFRCGRQNFMK